jgi:hypothetical protein
MSNAHIANNPANQPLVDAMTHVLVYGPYDAAYGSCWNVQRVLEEQNGGYGGIEAYSSSERYASSLMRAHQDTAYPVEERLSEITGQHPWEFKVEPKWSGYVGAMRRQWLNEVREFVKRATYSF